MDIEHIKEILKQLDNLYKEQSDNSQYNIPNELVCKMATLELCGWLEDKFDKMIMDCRDNFYKQLPKLDPKIPNKDFLSNFSSYNQSISKELNNVHGLSYTKHFRKLLVCLLGNPLVLVLEFNIGLDEMEIFSEKLDELHEYRGKLAHKSFPNISIQQTLDTPSVTINRFEAIIPTLQKFEDSLNSLVVSFSNTCIN
ncbi:MAG: HEPN domain-containing protein [Moraxella sp.]|nr:HEPN domain-containing protein [Moraxella sp.]